MTNQEIAKIFYEIAALYEMEGVEFKPRAYEKAAHSIEAYEAGIADVYKKGGIDALCKNPKTKIPGVGQSMAEHIAQLIDKGRFAEYERLKKKVPVDIQGLTAIEGVGPKMVYKLYKKLGVKTVDDLEKAAKAGKVRKLEDFGEKSEENILKGIEFLRKSTGRFILGFVLPDLKKIESRLKELPQVKQISLAGSVRRRKETVGDCDILITSDNPKPVMNFFVSMPEVERIYAHGPTKSAVKLKSGIDVDLRVVPPESFGAAMQYFTGSKDHNIALREIAIKKGWKLNEYGIFKGKKQIAGKTEEEVYKKLGLNYIEPEMRENLGEIQLAQKGNLPKLIGYNDLKGDLQIQTDWTDGANSIEEMAEEAKKLGLEYIAITDHTKSLAMTGGSDEKKLLRQMAAIDKLNSKIKNQKSKFKILKGAEVNILKNGLLDIADDVLAKLDVVGAAVHSHFNLSREEQSKRVIRAMENPNVDILFHPTGRIIQRRAAYDLDIDEIIKAAKRTGTILEIDAYPDRLDIKDEYVKKCVEQGVKLAIDSDAHSVVHIHYLEYGIAQARRGWAKKSDIVNTKPLKEFLKLLKNPPAW
ncbi:DNA polymerase III [Candidatus Azambacteria bacterium RIFCSPLOWO2_02_FULL_46_11]|uniref:DNA-directed DNA polymerase n=1 Tax=Candidatus Azambacteria bacterium RIFCSPLOWO2_02_FULL_46_11 TaxID=1797300 RepID=A0A1F5CNS1_9BACT|nr:MAG: DNA polymerase III [Candidatus Azambacteria bacterium RIFCSPLOWO2_02_FULL_46_11]